MLQGKKKKCNECSKETKIVIFELAIPKVVSSFRDAVHFFISKIISKSVETSKQLHGVWINQSDLAPYANKYQKLTTFGSISKHFAVSHYNAIIINLGTSLIEAYKPNGFSIDYCTLDKPIKYDINYDLCINLCSFTPLQPYNSLQLALKWVTHTENEIISKQSKCPKELELFEYIKYGFFRAGHNLQLLNLLDAVETRGLSFNHESVYMLISQALWQVAPITANERLINNNWYPDAHIDCTNIQYMNQMHTSLMNYLQVISEKWDDHIILLNIITITSRLMSLAPNDEIACKMGELLRECRKICLSWKEKVESILNKCVLSDFQFIDKIKEKLLQICSFGILTYNIDQIYLDHILNCPDDAVNWLEFSSKIYDIDLLLKK